MYKIINTTEEEITQNFYEYDEEGNPILDGNIVTIINKLVTTTVEYDLDGEIIIVDVNHFNPQSQDDIELGIQNREVTERRKLENG